MSTPKRIQLARKKGFRLPPGTINVARPTRWRNPFKVDATCSQETSVGLFRKWLFAAPPDGAGATLLRLALEALRGRDLACWCKPGTACHADVLLELVNDPRAEPMKGTVEVGEEIAIMGHLCKITGITRFFGTPSFEFEHIDGTQGGGIYLGPCMGRVYSPAVLDLCAGKEAA